MARDFGIVQGSGIRPHFIAQFNSGGLGGVDVTTNEGLGIVLLNPEDLSALGVIRTTKLTVDTTPVSFTNNLDYRVSIALANTDIANIIWIGENNTIGTDGFPLFPRAPMAIDMIAGKTLWFTGDQDGMDLRILELGNKPV